MLLTGIGLNVTTRFNANGLAQSSVPRVALLQSGQNFDLLDTGYFTWVDKYAQALK